MKAKRRISGLRTAVLAAAALVLAACNPIENETGSNSLLTIETLTALNMEGQEVNFCQSDVLYTDPQTGATSIVADIAKVALSADLLDPDPVLGASQYNDIELFKYGVTYRRSDGRNTEGVDVPYAFEEGMSGIIRIGQTASFSFILVREAAKQEPPLINLLMPSNRGETLVVTAQIDFYGKDLAGRAVKATGYIPVTFADFANQ